MSSVTYKAGRTGGAHAPAFARLARSFERLLFAVAVLALVASAFAYHRHWMPLLFPAIKQVELQGQFIHIDRLDVEQLVRSSVGDHFFDTDLYALKHSLETMPWVKRAYVTRVWPQSLRVEIEEHDAVARWGRHALLSSEGAMFAPTRFDADGLVTLYAAPGMELVALGRYRHARAALAVPGGAVVTALGEDRRGAWSLQLGGSLLVKVGDAHWDGRLDRFSAAWRDGLHTQFARIRCVDLRYPNGFAVAWKARREDCE